MSFIKIKFKEDFACFNKDTVFEFNFDNIYEYKLVGTTNSGKSLLLSLIDEYFKNDKQNTDMYEIETDFEKCFYLPHITEFPPFKKSLTEFCVTQFNSYFESIQDSLDNKTLILLDSIDIGVDLDNQAKLFNIGSQIFNTYSSYTIKSTNNIIDILVSPSIYYMKTQRIINSSFYVKMMLGLDINIKQTNYRDVLDLL